MVIAFGVPPLAYPPSPWSLEATFYEGNSASIDASTRTVHESEATKSNIVCSIQLFFVMV